MILVRVCARVCAVHVAEDTVTVLPLVQCVLGESTRERPEDDVGPPL